VTDEFLTISNSKIKTTKQSILCIHFHLELFLAVKFFFLQTKLFKTKIFVIFKKIKVFM